MVPRARIGATLRLTPERTQVTVPQTRGGNRLPIDYEKRDGVAYITLNNPSKANILDKPTSDAISEAIRRTRC